MATAALLVALTSLVTAILGTTLLRSYLLSRADSQLRDFATVATRIVERQQLRPPRQQPSADAARAVPGRGGQGGRADHHGGRPAGRQRTGHGCPPRSSATSESRSPPALRVRRETPGESWCEQLSGGGHLVIASSLGGLDSTVTRLEIADALAAAAAIVLLAGLGLPLVRASLAPLREIESTAAAIAGGDLSRRIDHAPGNTEVGRLADALDTMLASIEAAYLARAEGEARALQSQERMRRFIADASHELRTPLTSVRGLAEYGLQQGDGAGPEELLRLMGLIVGEAGRMGRLVDDLLLLARFDAGRALERGPVDLASIAAEAVQQARIVAAGRPITLEAAEPVIVHADAGAAAPDHRQPDRQRHPAHPARNAGSGERVERARQRAAHRR